MASFIRYIISLSSLGSITCQRWARRGWGRGATRTRGSLQSQQHRQGQPPAMVAARRRSFGKRAGLIRQRGYRIP